MIVAPDPFFIPNRAKLVQFTARKRLPAVYFFKIFADDGGLMAYGASGEESHRRAAAQVDKILNGGKARGPSRRAADAGGARDQSQDGAVARTHAPRVVATAS
jgi:hypothetical protein